MVDEAITERVRIRKHINDILNYVPKKGIDITFTQVDPDDTNPRSPKLLDAVITMSNAHPDYPLERKDMTELLAGWRGIVSDRVRTQGAEPLKHKIVTIVNRPKIQDDPVLLEKVEAIPVERKFKDEFGNDLVEIFNEDVKEL